MKMLTGTVVLFVLFVGWVEEPARRPIPYSVQREIVSRMQELEDMSAIGDTKFAKKAVGTLRLAEKAYGFDSKTVNELVDRVQTLEDKNRDTLASKGIYQVLVEEEGAIPIAPHKGLANQGHH